MHNVGLALISYDRPSFLKQALDSLESNLWGGANHRLVVVDEPYDEEKYGWTRKYPGLSFIYKDNKGVAPTKNLALSNLLANECEHLFIMEDDILMSDQQACTKYVDYASQLQVPHLNFALHGELNIGRKKIAKWQRPGQMESTICVYPHCVGAFSYYSREIIELVGLIDENFINAWDHVEHTWRICQTGQVPPFWYFMDHPDSNSLLKEQVGSLFASVIRKDPSWQEKVDAGRAYWIQKHGEFLPPMPNWNP
jgi:GT2 family glycosyltransferase